jgi:hypothetical protein
MHPNLPASGAGERQTQLQPTLHQTFGSQSSTPFPVVGLSFLTNFRLPYAKALVSHREKYGNERSHGAMILGKLDSKGETVMNAAQIKNEIRKLNQIDKIEIYRWIDREVAKHLFCSIGVYRSLQIRQEIEQKCKVISPGGHVHLGNKKQDSFDLADQASPERPRTTAYAIPHSGGPQELNDLY